MSLVFDAEPLIAYFEGEAGAEVVERLLRKTASGEEEGFVAAVNMAEVLHVLLRRRPEEAESLVDWLRAMGLRIDSSEVAWRGAARIKAEFGIGLADAFALETARVRGAQLIAGTDPAMATAKSLGVDLRRISGEGRAQ